MNAGWLEIEGPGGTQRSPMKEGLTRIGGAGADIRLEGGGDAPKGDELHVWDSPPRIVFVGRGARPTFDGRTFDERMLGAGDRVHWNGHHITYAAATAAEETAPDPTSAARFAERVRAALACELGLVDAQVAKRWRASARAAGFDADACARELVPTPPSAAAERKLLERAGVLVKDAVGGASGASGSGAAPSAGAAPAPASVRRRERANASSPGVLSFLLIQLLSFLVFASLVAAILYVLRLKGVSVDAHLDRLMERLRSG